MGLAYGETSFREMHAAEMDRHEKLHGRIALPTVIVTVLCGAASLYIQKCPADCYDIAKYDTPLTAFVICLLFLCIALGVAIFCIIRALLFNLFRYPASPDKIKQYLDSVETWYGANEAMKREDIPVLLANDLWEMMSAQYLECATTNRNVSSDRGRWIYFSYWAIIVAIVWSVLSILPFHYISSRADTIHKVRIVP